jgi:hypothetical protein
MNDDRFSWRFSSMILSIMKAGKREGANKRPTSSSGSLATCVCMCLNAKLAHQNCRRVK